MLGQCAGSRREDKGCSGRAGLLSRNLPLQIRRQAEKPLLGGDDDHLRLNSL